MVHNVMCQIVSILRRYAWIVFFFIRYCQHSVVLLCEGDLTLDPPMEKFLALVDNLFDKLPYLVTESSIQICGSDATAWPQCDEHVEPTRYVEILIWPHTVGFCLTTPFSGDYSKLG